VADTSRIDELRRRVQRDPASIAFAQLAEEYRRAGRYREAIETCEGGLSHHPGYLSARVTLGRALLEMGNLDGAQVELGQVLRAAPENLAALKGLAEIHHRRGELREALTHYRMALEFARTDPELQHLVEQIEKELEPGSGAVPIVNGLSFEEVKDAFLNLILPEGQEAARAESGHPRTPELPAEAVERPVEAVAGSADELRADQAPAVPPASWSPLVTPSAEASVMQPTGPAEAVFDAEPAPGESLDAFPLEHDGQGLEAIRAVAEAAPVVEPPDAVESPEVQESQAVIIDAPASDAWSIPDEASAIDVVASLEARPVIELKADEAEAVVEPPTVGEEPPVAVMPLLQDAPASIEAPPDAEASASADAPVVQDPLSSPEEPPTADAPVVAEEPVSLDASPAAQALEPAAVAHFAPVAETPPVIEPDAPEPGDAAEVVTQPAWGEPELALPAMVASAQPGNGAAAPSVPAIDSLQRWLDVVLAERQRRG
jgi:cellulose synthase operon protein C